MLHLIQGNRSEALARELAGLLRVPRADAMDPEVVVVDSPGTARWLALGLADHLGVCGNVRFPLPAAFAWETFSSVLKGLPPQSHYSPDVLVWRILAILPEMVEEPGFEAVAHYLRDADDVKSYALARRLAQLYDRYLVYRPDWIRDWERGRVDHWQAALWRRVTAACGSSSHWGSALEAFREGVRAGRVEGRDLPERVALFTPSALSPGYIAFLEDLGMCTEVHLFLLNPCAEYWGDILPRRARVRREARGIEAGVEPEEGNVLLASWGRQGRDLMDLLAERDSQGREVFEDPGGETLLHRLQSDILHLRHADSGNARSPDDESVQVHVCHSPMREVQVLHDRLLSMFEADPELSPADVAVLAPAIADFTPYVQAVFATAPQSQRIPFTIADRPRPVDSPAGVVLLALMKLPESRLDVVSVIELLEAPPVADRFDFDADDLARIRRWIADTEIRWARDGRDRGELGLPATDQNTWRWGLDRMLLGYALADRRETLFAGLAPCPGIEGQEARLLGRFQAFMERLFQVRDVLAEVRHPGAWIALVRELCADFIGAEGHGTPSVLQALSEWEDELDGAGFAQDLSRELVIEHLKARLEREREGVPPLNGTVTFASMGALRSVPFRVVAVLGLNDGEFPGLERPLDFDLMAGKPRRGDPSLRDAHRYLFLECLLSARTCLYLSHVGRDIRENSVIPPSVVLSELSDCVRGDSPRKSDGLPVIRHPLQPFSPRYFGADERLFSYSASLCAAGKAGRGSGVGLPVFLRGPLPEPADRSWREVELDRFVAFFMNPARYLLSERLGVLPSGDTPLPETTEPFDLGYAAEKELGNELVEAFAGTGAGSRLVQPRFAALGRLPLGAIGDAHLAACERRVRPMAERLKVFPGLESPALEPQRVDLDLGALRVTGWLKGVREVGLVAYRTVNWGPHALLQWWLNHLVLNAVEPPGVSCETRLLGIDVDYRLPRSKDPMGVLTDLADLYHDGLSGPLEFFPRTSHAYVQRLLKSEETDALRKAEAEWLGNDYHAGECTDPSYRLVFRSGVRFEVGTPQARRFGEIAGRVFLPLCQSLESM